jgi:hypothetical protein
VVVPSSSPVTRRPPSLHGVPRGGSPASSVLRRRSDSHSPFPLRFVAFARRYRGGVRPSLSRVAGLPAPASLDSLIAGCPSGLTPRRRLGLPGSWMDPCAPAPLSDPGGISTPGPYRRLDAAACKVTTQAPSSRNFRGSIPRLTHSLSTLRRAQSPAPHARLASGWWPACAGQVSHLLGPLRKVSKMATSSLPPSPGFAWRNTFLPVPERVGR